MSGIASREHTDTHTQKNAYSQQQQQQRTVVGLSCSRTSACVSKQQMAVADPEVATSAPSTLQLLAAVMLHNARRVATVVVLDNNAKRK